MTRSNPFRSSRISAFRPLRLLAVVGASILSLALVGTTLAWAEGFKAGLSFDEAATPADIGLPLYPGAKPWTEKNDEKDSAQIRLWGGSFGFTLAAGQFLSSDPLDRVAAFYREALAKKGTVLDCGQPGQVDTPLPKASGSDDVLRCKTDKPKPGGRLLKAGLSSHQFQVSLEPGPDGKGTRIGLVRLELKGVAP
ncbi:MAG TPA: hypothetical protein VLA61_25830 [Ideonella sp.]|uniref:hypothetical protein n=1 Tax=Ideonella sp. TaxID=1929293 RepID=UPI002BA7C61A|nr:hypothetical protein [Ideonella sp.]HSI51704.1 hypothetical protein [Ideonella sp.]